MNNKKYLVIVSVMILVFGLGCIDSTSSKSGVDKERTVTNPAITTTENPVNATVIQTQPITTTITTSIPTPLDRYTIVTNIVDGDTIYIDNREKVRFVGVNTPEVGQPGYNEAKQYVNDKIMNQRIYLDVDDKNPKDKYGRTLAVIIINNDNLNQELLCKRYAEVMYIPPSEFDPYSWDNSCELGTPTSTQTSTPTPTIHASCDPSYPDFCIPPPPPDLNCDDIPQKNFKVLQPDPHKLDRDKDGIGCEAQ